jgi:hypothetical protein
MAHTPPMHVIEHPKGAAAVRRRLKQRRRQIRLRVRLVLLRPDVDIVAARAEDGVVKRRSRPVVHRRAVAALPFKVSGGVVLVEESEGCERILEVCADVVLVAVHVGQPFVRAVTAVVRIVADDALGIK